MKRISFGRSKECDIVLPQPVSRVHGYLLIDSNKAYIVDNNSRNGTFVNGKRIRGKVHLSPGDKVMIAKKFHLDWSKYINVDDDETVLSYDETMRGSYPNYGYSFDSDNNIPDRPLVDIPSRIEINKNYAEVYRNGNEGADWKVPFKRNMGDKIGNAVGSTLGCIFSIILIICFLGILFSILGH